MDTFFEQILSIRKNGKTLALISGIWALAVILVAALYLFGGYIGSIAFVLMGLVIYGAFKLSCLFNIEYEYIITNGTMDVDKIINKSSRKRVLSFELSGVTRIEKFNPAILNSIDKKKVLFASNENDENNYLLVSETEGKGAKYLVFSPDDRIKGAIEKFVPKFVSNSAFK